MADPVPPQKQRNLLEFARYVFSQIFDSTAGAIKTTSQAIVNGDVIVNPQRGTSAPEKITSISNVAWSAVDITSTEYITIRSNSDGIGLYAVFGIEGVTDEAAEFAAGRFYEIAPATFDGSGRPTSFEDKMFPTDGQDRVWLMAVSGTGNEAFIHKVLSP